MGDYENVTFIGFLIASVVSMSLFLRWLVMKIIKIVESVVNSQGSLKNTIDQNTMIMQQLQQSIENMSRDVRDIRT